MKALYITTIGVTMGFFCSFIEELINSGWEVDIATNENNGETPVPDIFNKYGCTVYQIDTSRSPYTPHNIRALKQIKRIVKKGCYDIVHCHTPVAAALTRMACKRLRGKGVKVYYTAHGFHFYTGAPILNWLMYYPLEKILSRWTDTLITINKEDYERARKKFYSKKVVYVPGVGIDINTFRHDDEGKRRIRAELGISHDQIMLLSVGELNNNKNHESVIKAIAGMKLIYVIVGYGENHEKIKALASELGVDLRLMGFRFDVVDFYSAADFYILPSIREGLNVSLMEAMASGLPCLCGRIRGNVDLIDEGKGGYCFNPLSITEIKTAIEMVVKNKLHYGDYNRNKIISFDRSVINSQMKEIYSIK